MQDSKLDENLQTMGNNTHVTDVGGLVHEITDLILRTRQRY